MCFVNDHNGIPSHLFDSECFRLYLDLVLRINLFPNIVELVIVLVWVFVAVKVPGCTGNGGRVVGTPACSSAS
jgi:hypothetical protein